MNLTRRTLLASSALALSPTFAFAQAFPSRSIRIVVPYPPGSNPDILARLVGEDVGARLRQPVVVENKPGAGGMLGSDAAAKAAPDGYTLLVGDSGPLAIAPNIYAKVPYSSPRDFAGVAGLVAVPLVMLVPRTATATSATAFVAQARARPGELLYGSLGVGSIHHLVAESLCAATGIKMTHVPYKSNGELATAVVNGDVQMAFSGIPSVEGFIKDKRLQALGVSTARRSATLPEVMTLQEQGIPNFDVASSIGIVAPAGVPADRLKLLEEAFLAALKEPRVAERVVGLGMLARPASGADYQATIAAEIERFGSVVRTAGIQLQ